MTDLALRTDIEVSPFAWTRIRDMKLDLAEVLDVLDHPEVDAPLPSKDERRMAKGGRLLVLYAGAGGRRRVITVAWADAESETVFADDLEMDEGPSADEAGSSVAEAAPPPRMNDIFLSQLKLWGCTEGRRNGDWLTVRAPDGQMLRVRPPDALDETPPVVAERAYQLLGVSAEVFWSRMTRVRPPRERLFAPKPAGPSRPARSEPAPVRARPEPLGPVTDLFPKRFAPKPPRRRSRTEDVLTFFKIRPGATFDASTVADALELDVSAVSLIVTKLARDHKLERVTRGRYRLATATDEPAGRLAEINAELLSTSDPLRRVELIQERIDVMARMDADDVAVPDGKQASTFVTDPWEDEIDVLVDLLAPDGVPAAQLDAVERWRNDTRVLIEKLRT